MSLMSLWKRTPPDPIVGWQFHGNHEQKSHGRKGGGGVDIGGATTKTKSFEQEQADAIAFFKTQGVTPSSLQKNVESVFANASPEAKAYGMDWYQEANGFAKGLATRQGISEKQAAGIVAAVSPQLRWDKSGPNDNRGNNKKAAEAVGTILSDIKSGKSFTLKKETVDSLIDNRVNKILEQVRINASWGKSSDIGPFRTSRLALENERKELMKYVGTNKAGDIPSSVLAAFHPARKGYLPDNIAKAIDIGRGGDPDKILSGAKVRSFYDNIHNPKGQSATIDSHQVRAMVQKLSLSDKDYQAFIRTPARYSVFRDSLQTSAAKLGILPNQLQAVTWEQWRMNNTQTDRRMATLNARRATLKASKGS